MTIEQTIESLEELQNKSEIKKEKKVYQIFINIIKSLPETNLGADKTQDILQKISDFEFSTLRDQNYKYINTKLKEFIKILENDFGLLAKQHYLTLGMSLGMVFGLAIATIFNWNLGLNNPTTGGLIVGMMVGMFIGSIMDKQAESDKKVFHLNA